MEFKGKVKRDKQESLSALQELIQAKNKMESKVLTGNSVLLIGTGGEAGPISTINTQSLKSSQK